MAALRFTETTWRDEPCSESSADFLLKTNALALAIGVIIGTALGTVVNSLVNDIIMPPIGMLLGGVDFGALEIKLKAAVGGDPAPEVEIRYGAFINSIIAFVVIAFVVWRISRMFIKEAARGRGQDLPVLQGGERGWGDEVPSLREHDLRPGRRWAIATGSQVRIRLAS